MRSVLIKFCWLALFMLAVGNCMSGELEFLQCEVVLSDEVKAGPDYLVDIAQGVQAHMAVLDRLELDAMFGISSSNEVPTKDHSVYIVLRINYNPIVRRKSHSLYLEVPTLQNLVGGTDCSFRIRSTNLWGVRVHVIHVPFNSPDNVRRVKLLSREFRSNVEISAMAVHP